MVYQYTQRGIISSTSMYTLLYLSCRYLETKHVLLVKFTKTRFVLFTCQYFKVTAWKCGVKANADNA